MGSQYYFGLLFAALLCVAPADWAADQKKEKYCCGTNAEGKTFLDQMKGRAGVITLKSGLQYRVLTKGTGRWHPKLKTPCRMHFHGTSLSLTQDAINKDPKDWREFDSTYRSVSEGTAWMNGPKEFIPGGKDVLKAMTEALQMMVEGDMWELYVPSELGYGDEGKHGGFGLPAVKGGEVLIIRTEMIRIDGDIFKKNIATDCDFKNAENCDKAELALLEKWGKKSVKELKAQIKTIKKKLDDALTPKVREEVLREVHALKAMKKMQSGKEEL